MAKSKKNVNQDVNQHEEVSNQDVTTSLSEQLTTAQNVLNSAHQAEEDAKKALQSASDENFADAFKAYAVAQSSVKKAIADVTTIEKAIEREQVIAEKLKPLNELKQAISAGSVTEEHWAAVESAIICSRTSSTRATSGAPRTGTIKAQIQDVARDMFADGAGGATVRARVIRELGYNDGTANAAIVEVERELGLR